MKTQIVFNPGIMTVLILSLISCSVNKKELSQKIILSDHWMLQQSSKTKETGSILSTDKSEITGWYSASVPSTVMGILSRNENYKNIFMGENLKKVDKSQFDSSWWYRKEFIIPDLGKDQHVMLCFDGISYYANIWLNGRIIASKDSIFGTFRRFQFDVTDLVIKNNNILAVEIFKQHPGDFGLGFVDWNPRPPDENMGIWREVYLHISGEVGLNNTYVQTKVNLENLKEAWLSISTEIKNYSSETVTGKLKGKIENKEFEYPVQLSPGEHKLVTITADNFSCLHFINPRLWWCNNLGVPNLYKLNLSFVTENAITDNSDITFGIRDVQSYFNKQGYKGFKLNGKEVLIKGAGWTDDLFLRDTKESNEIQVQYAKHMNLNAIRFEGIWGNSQNIYDLCDKYGILAIVGWSCQWEWNEYLGKECNDFGGIQTATDFNLVYQYTEDQIKWLRNHPSILVWMIGSDKFPKPEFEKKFKLLVDSIDDRPYQSSAGTKVSTISGPTGVKMNGPYEYVGPNYWYIDSVNGGAFGFNTETGPGPQIPVIESIKKMIPDDKLWPISDAWNNHCTAGKEFFNNLNIYNEALKNRYGPANDLNDYLLKSNVMSYEAMRAMFEAFRTNIPNTTGIIQWMLNSAWPSMYWHLYDYNLLPTSAYYAARKANSPVQLIYNYGNQGVYAVNETLTECKKLKATIQVFDFNSNRITSNEVNFKIGENSSKKISEIKKFRNNAFLAISLFDAQNRLITDNFYWLSDKQDEYAWDKTNWAFTPMKEYADFKALNTLPSAEIDLSTHLSHQGENIIVHVKLKNVSDKIAFFINLTLKNDSGNTIFPVFWDDNYINLLPGETKNINCDVPKNISSINKIELIVSGWNMKSQNLTLQ